MNRQNILGRNGVMMAKLISCCFHPAVIWVIGILTVSLRDVSPIYWACFIGLLLSAVSVGAAYIAVFPYGKSLDHIMTYGLSKKERLRAGLTLALLAGLIIDLGISAALAKPAANLLLFFASAIQILIYSRVLAARITISAHVVAATSLITILCLSISPAYASLALIIPIVAFSRVSLNAHTWGETLAGFLMGFAVVLLTFEVGGRIWR